MIDVPAVAAQQSRDYRAGTPGLCFADPAFQPSLKEAYLIQDEVTRLRQAAGDHVVGYKVGCIGPGTTAQFGMSGPVRGTLYASEVRRAGEPLPTASFASLAIEAEMAVTMGSDGWIASAFPVIELHNFVFRRSLRTLEELVANNALNAGIVLPRRAVRPSRNHVSRPGVLSVALNGEVVGSGNLWPMPGGAESSVLWLQQHLAETGRSLAAGDIVLTGTVLGLYPIKPGTHVLVTIDGVILLECQFGATACP